MILNTSNNKNESMVDVGRKKKLSEVKKNGKMKAFLNAPNNV